MSRTSAPDVPALRARLARARVAAARAGLAALLVSPGSDLRYLLGAGGQSFERLTCLVLPAGNRCRISATGSSAEMTAGSRRIIGPTSSSFIQPTSSGLRIVKPRKWKRQVAKE